MSQADQIRQFVLERFIVPASAQGHTEITVRAGDVHLAMGLANAMPAVCGAIRSGKFSEMTKAVLREQTGPANGANVYFRFSLNGADLSRRDMKQISVVGRQNVSPNKPSGRFDLQGALVLVSCVRSKQTRPVPARELYTSVWFRKVRAILEASDASWFILSALHGLVRPDTILAPYEHTLNSASVAERRAWARRTLDELLPVLSKERRVVFFAGQRYREFLVEPLRRTGIIVEVPLANLAIGKQLAWLSQEQ